MLKSDSMFKKQISCFIVRTFSIEYERKKNLDMKRVQVSARVNNFLVNSILWHGTGMILRIVNLPHHLGRVQTYGRDSEMCNCLNSRSLA